MPAKPCPAIEPWNHEVGKDLEDQEEEHASSSPSPGIAARAPRGLGGGSEEERN